MLDIGSTIKLCREARKLTLQELSDRTDLTKSYLSRIENNQRDPTITALEKISLSFFLKVKRQMMSFLISIICSKKL